MIQDLLALELGEVGALVITVFALFFGAGLGWRWGRGDLKS